MAKHHASRYVRTKHVLAGVPVAAGATIIGLGVLSAPAQAATTQHWTHLTNGTVAAAAAAPVPAPAAERPSTNPVPDVVVPGQVLVISGAEQTSPAAAALAVPTARAVAAAPAAVRAAAVAHIINSAGPVKPQTQAAANAVVTNVPGAAGITIGGTRASAVDPKGHPSGLALDYMVRSNTALGDAIARYHVAHWNQLGVDYVIWQQKILTSPTGSWKKMADRGSPTANHMDHVHVNYRG
jgi:hypothetical protein